MSVLRMRGWDALSRLSLSGGALILGSKDDLAGQFSRLVKRGWSFMPPDQSPLTMAQVQACADLLI